MTSSPAISHGPEAAVEDGFAIAARSVHSAAAVPAGGVHCGSCRTCCVQDVQFTDQWWRCFWPDPCRFPSWILAHPRNQAGFCCLQAESLLCIQWLQLSPGAGGAALFLAGRAESVTGSTNHPLSPSYLFYRASYLFKASILIYLSPKEQRPLRSGCKSSQPPCMQTLPSSAGAWLDPLPPALTTVSLLLAVHGAAAAGQDSQTMLACLQRTQNPPGQHLACPNPNKALEPRKCKFPGLRGGIVCSIVGLMGCSQVWDAPRSVMLQELGCLED